MRRWRMATVVITLLVASSCTGSSAGEVLTTTDDGRPTWEIPTDADEVAQFIIPWKEYQASKFDIPSATLASFLACTEDLIGHEVVILTPAELIALTEADGTGQIEQELAASDCALQNGIDEYAAIWVPTTENDMLEQYGHWVDAASLCVTEAGVEDPPTVEYLEGIPVPDIPLLVRQDPSLEDPIRRCMDKQDQEYPDDDE